MNFVGDFVVLVCYGYNICLFLFGIFIVVVSFSFFRGGVGCGIIYVVICIGVLSSDGEFYFCFDNFIVVVIVVDFCFDCVEFGFVFF